ncbi:MAG: glycerol dehydrogenase [Geobacteraceae bacterium]
MRKAKSVSSPNKFFITKDIMSNIAGYTSIYGHTAYVICDEFILSEAENSAGKSLKNGGHEGVFMKFGGENSDNEINKHREGLKDSSADYIIGIGGGKTLDCAKAAACYENVPVVIFPTLASTDAPCTAISVIYNPDGAFNRYLYLPRNPDIVLADVNILAHSPSRFFAAGIGDALSTYFEARACYAAEGENLLLYRPSFTGLGIAKLCYETIRQYGVQAMKAVKNKVATSAVEKTLEATIYMSGIGAETGGLAAAHAIHNGMSAVPDLRRAQHGEKIAFTTMVQLTLEGTSDETFKDIAGFIKSVELPMTLEDLGMKEFKENEWKKVTEDACAKSNPMGNMPFKVTSDDVYQAIIATNEMMKTLK